MSRYTELREQFETEAKKHILGELRKEFGEELVGSEIAPNLEIEAVPAVRIYYDGGFHFTCGGPEVAPHSRHCNWAHYVAYLQGSYDRRYVYSTKDVSEVYELAVAYADTKWRASDFQHAYGAGILGYIQGYVRTSDSMEATDGR